MLKSIKKFKLEAALNKNSSTSKIEENSKESEQNSTENNAKITPENFTNTEVNSTQKTNENSSEENPISLELNDDKNTENNLLENTAQQDDDSADKYLEEFSSDLIEISPEMNSFLLEKNFTQEQIQTVYNVLEKFVLPEVLEMYHDLKSITEIEKLKAHFGGEEKFQQIASQLQTWAQNEMDTDTFNTLASSFQGVIALCKMMENNQLSDNMFAPAPLENNDFASKERELKNAMQNPLYWRDKNPEYVAKIQNGFKNLYA